MAKFKPCPFCGGRHQKVEHIDGVYVVTCECTAEGPIRRTWDDALKAWNDRREPTTDGDGGEA